METHLILLKTQKYCRIYYDTQQNCIKKYFGPLKQDDQRNSMRDTALALKDAESRFFHTFSQSKYLLRLLRETDHYFDIEFWNRGDFFSVYSALGKDTTKESTAKESSNSAPFHTSNANELHQWSMKLKIATHLALGLRDIHQEGYLHGDIKSANVLLNANWDACWCDFAFSRRFEKDSTAPQRGTIFWMPPEMLRLDDRATQSLASDVFSFGVVLWEIATLQRPYPGMNSFDVSQKVPQGYRMVIPADTPFSELIAQCWMEDMDQRPRIDEICALLEQIELKE